MAERKRPLISGGSQPEDLRKRRLRQLERMADEQVAAEVRWQQAAIWRHDSLARHAKKHQRDFLRLLGRELSPSELDTLSRDVLRSWDRLLTRLEVAGPVTYYFLRLLPDPETAIIVVTRLGNICSAFPTDRLERWLQRQPTVIEVTDRGRRLGL